MQAGWGNDLAALVVQGKPAGGGGGGGVLSDLSPPGLVLLLRALHSTAAMDAAGAKVRGRRCFGAEWGSEGHAIPHTSYPSPRTTLLPLFLYFKAMTSDGGPLSMLLLLRAERHLPSYPPLPQAMASDGALSTLLLLLLVERHLPPPLPSLS